MSFKERGANRSEPILCPAPAVKPVVPKCSVPKSVPVGKSAELRCVEDEGFPQSKYQWFRDKEEIPGDPKSSPKFFNSSYTLNVNSGTLVRRRRTDAGGEDGGWVWGCGPGSGEERRGVEGERNGGYLDILGRQLMC